MSLRGAYPELVDRSTSLSGKGSANQSQFIDNNLSQNRDMLQKKEYCVYIMSNEVNTTLYTGVTNNQKKKGL